MAKFQKEINNKETISDISEGTSKAICILIYTCLAITLIGLALLKLFCK